MKYNIMSDSSDTSSESNTSNPSSSVGTTDQLLDPLRGKAEHEAEQEEDTKLLRRIQQRVEEAVDSGEVRGEEPLEGELILPYDKEVIDQALIVMKKKKQEFYAQKLGIEDEEKIRRLRVEKLDDGLRQVMNQQHKILIQFGIQLAQFHDDILQEIEDRTEQDIQNPLKNVKEPIMARKIAVNIGPKKNITILYGARKIIYNLCDDLGFTTEQINFIRLCHNIAAKKNNLHLYTLAEDVVFIDSSLHKRVAVEDDGIRELEDDEEVKEETEIDVTEDL